MLYAWSFFNQLKYPFILTIAVLWHFYDRSAFLLSKIYCKLECIGLKLWSKTTQHDRGTKRGFNELNVEFWEVSGVHTRIVSGTEMEEDKMFRKIIF